jgi:hypothetical protein
MTKQESALRRAWLDTVRFIIGSPWYWLMYQAGTLGLTVVASKYVNVPGSQASFIFCGILIEFAAIVVWNLVFAPVRQRDQARKQVLALEGRWNAQQVLNRKRDRLTALMLEGQALVDAALSISNQDGLSSATIWSIQVYELLPRRWHSRFLDDGAIPDANTGAVWASDLAGRVSRLAYIAEVITIDDLEPALAAARRN